MPQTFLFPTETKTDEIDDEVSMDTDLEEDKSSKNRLTDVLPPGVSLVQASHFQAGVKLDERRPPSRQWGLRPWFSTWCKMARPGWLDPLGGTWGLMRLEDNLRKFQGEQEALRPILANLFRVTREGVSPSAFLRYAVLARVGSDFDWRSWDRLHSTSITTLADLVIKLKGHRPFDHPLGGSRKINPEVVLVKYTLRPLARLSQVQLENQKLLEAYVDAWQALALDHPMAVFFFRKNIFPFLYALSGRIDLIPLTEILKSLPTIEQAFRLRYPESSYGAKIQDRADQIFIYGIDVEAALEDRRNQGMSDLDLVQELRVYLRLLGRLLTRESAIFLAGFLAKVFQRFPGDTVGPRIERLLDLLGDREGLQIYEWHIHRLVALPDQQQEAYLETLQANGGLDPRYRIPQDIFQDNVVSDLRGNQELETKLGLPRLAKGPRSATQVVEDYITIHPELKAEYQEWKDDIFEAKDRSWGPKKFPNLDQAGKDFHKALLRSTIRGLGHYDNGNKSLSWKNLWDQYGIANVSPSFEVRQTLTLTEAVPPKHSGDPEIRKTLKLEFLEQHWHRIQGPVQSPDAAAALLLRQSLELKEARSRLLTEAQNPHLTDKERTKLNQQSRAVLKKFEDLERVQEVFPSLTPVQKWIVALVVGAHVLKKPEELTAVLLAPYREQQEFRERFRFLQSDLRIEIINLDQLGWLINLWETVATLVRQDQSVQLALESDSSWQEVLKPYLITKKKILSMEALDAAVKTIAQISRLTGEQVRWQTLLEKSSQTTFRTRNLVISASKAPLDCYYGDMGGICLSSRPKMILNPGFHVLRLFDGELEQIVGEAVLFLNPKPIRSYDPTKPIWFFFAINYLPSQTKGLGIRQQLKVYLGFRSVAQRISKLTGFPLAIPGYKTWGIVSNNGQFEDLIVNFERNQGAVPVTDAFGFNLYYDEYAYAEALVLNGNL